MTDHLTKTLAEALRDADQQLNSAADCLETGRRDEAYLHCTAKSVQRREALALFDAAQQAVDPTDPGHEVEVLREHVRHLERRVRQLAGVQQAAGEQALPPMTLGAKFLHQEVEREMADFVTPREARAAQAAQPLPVLLRDLCRELGVGVPEACAALREAGLGESSQGSAVTPAMARALRDRFEAQPLPVRDEREAGK